MKRVSSLLSFGLVGVLLGGVFVVEIVRDLGLVGIGDDISVSDFAESSSKRSLSESTLSMRNWIMPCTCSTSLTNLFMSVLFEYIKQGPQTVARLKEVILFVAALSANFRKNRSTKKRESLLGSGNSLISVFAADERFGMLSMSLCCEKGWI